MMQIVKNNAIIESRFVARFQIPRTEPLLGCNLKFSKPSSKYAPWQTRQYGDFVHDRGASNRETIQLTAKYGP